MMKFKQTMKVIAVGLLMATAPMSHAAQPHSVTAQQLAQKSFAAPEEAGKALAEAVRAHDVNALLIVVGPSSRSWLFSGDDVADIDDWQRFLAAYDRKSAISLVGDDRAILLVGDSDWPFPAPLVRQSGAWVFDAAAGREEILNRRIGSNELGTIQTLLAVVDAQREYAAGDLDGNGVNDYAQRFLSSEGKRDGLYWPVEANQPMSPLGPLVGVAASKKLVGSKPTPYHGYYYRMLTAQGKAAPGGAYNYLVKDKMIGGFAVLAYPAKYGVSGVMSFLVNHDGTVYQKNLGKNTALEASRIKQYSPDSSWKKTQ